MRIFAVVLVCILPLSIKADFEEGVQAYAEGRYRAAIAEFQPLAEQGRSDAQYFMGFLYHNGFGVARDQAVAAKWFHLAAVQGHALSEYYLGVLYAKGEGVEQDLAVAHMWLTVSLTNFPNHRDALYTKEEIEKLERKMSDTEIARASELARNWKPEKK